MRPSFVLSSILRERICSPKAFNDVLDATTLVNGKLGANEVGLITSIFNKKVKTFFNQMFYLKKIKLPFESTIGEPILAILICSKPRDLM